MLAENVVLSADWQGHLFERAIEHRAARKRAPAGTWP